MERRVTSHTEEEEMNQRRRLLTLARKGDQKAVELLFELYQVRVFSGDALKKKKLPSFPMHNPTLSPGRGQAKPGKKIGKISKLSTAEGMSKPVQRRPQHVLKKKPGVPAAKSGGKSKKIKSFGQKPKKGRPSSTSQRTSRTLKRGGTKKSASGIKAKPKKPTLSARPTRVKKN